MKRLFFALLIVGILMSCSKDNPILDAKDLIGTWRWVKSTGGISGDTETPESTGKQIALEISEDTYKKFVNGVLELEQTYFIGKGQSIWTPQISDLLILEDDSKQSIELDGNKLILYDECYDCFQNEYVRQ